MKKYIVITGAAGFIGSCLVRHLNEQGQKHLLLVDALGSTEKWKNLVGKEFADLLHKDHLFSWLQGKEHMIEAVVHLGACSSTMETDGNYLLENNYHYSVRLAEVCLPRKIPFLYASSAATYGDGLSGFSDDHDHLERYRPLNLYGYSKHLFDLWLKNRSFLDRVVGLKFFNVFGPNEYHKGMMRSALLKMVAEVEEKGEVSLFKSNDPAYKDGEQVRDFIYVKDVVTMIAACLSTKARGIFNVGTKTPQTWNTLAKALFSSLKRECVIRYKEMPEALKGKYQNRTCADMSKWEKAGLPLPSYSFEEAVFDYVHHYIIPGKYW